MKTSRLGFLVFAAALCGAPALASEPKDSVASTPGITRMVPIMKLQKGPVVVKKVMPVYPSELRERGIQGFATVQLLVDSTGRVVEVAVARATQPEFAARAQAAARTWIFEPAIADGRPVATRVEIPFDFIMPEVAAMEAR